MSPALLMTIVAIISHKSLAVTGKITAGKNPDGLAWAVRK